LLQKRGAVFGRRSNQDENRDLKSAGYCKEAQIGSGGPLAGNMGKIVFKETILSGQFVSVGKIDGMGKIRWRF
jgi:hypothetical protein